MDALSLLRSQHREVKQLFSRFEKTGSESKKKSIFLRVADALAAHAEIEETIFYPAAFRDALEDQLREAVEEHLAAKRLIADLLEMDVDDRQFDAKMTVLAEQIRHHIEEEQDDLFPKVRKLLSRAELNRLGNQMSAKFDALMEHEPRTDVPRETEEAARLGDQP
ncbi:MAG: hemerythrin domain-containing protein [Myxococcaceae bacterium]